MIGLKLSKALICSVIGPSVLGMMASKVEAQSCSGAEVYDCIEESFHVDAPQHPGAAKYVNAEWWVYIGAVPVWGEVKALALCHRNVLDPSQTYVSAATNQSGEVMFMNAQNQLTQHVSYCGSGGGDKIWAGQESAALLSCDGFQFEEVQTNGYRLTISGRLGEDYIEPPWYADASQRACGGASNDVLDGTEAGAVTGFYTRLFGGGLDDALDGDPRDYYRTRSFGESGNDNLGGGYSCNGGPGNDSCSFCSSKSSCEW